MITALDNTGLSLDLSFLKKISNSGKRNLAFKSGFHAHLRLSGILFRLLKGLERLRGNSSFTLHLVCIDLPNWLLLIAPLIHSVTQSLPPESPHLLPQTAQRSS